MADIAFGDGTNINMLDFTPSLLNIMPGLFLIQKFKNKFEFEVIRLFMCVFLIHSFIHI